MAKSSLERQIERQMKQSKQLANKKRREQDKAERRAILKDRAATIINGQPIIEGFRVMDQTAEAILECLLNCERGNGTHIYSETILSGQPKKRRLPPHIFQAFYLAQPKGLCGNYRHFPAKRF